MSQARRSLLAAISIVYAIPALASAPPTRFDHPPKIPVKIVRAEHIPKICRNPAQKIGCSFAGGPRCVIYIARKLPKDWYSGVLRHEKAHCNGWPGHHPR